MNPEELWIQEQMAIERSALTFNDGICTNTMLRRIIELREAPFFKKEMGVREHITLYSV